MDEQQVLLDRIRELEIKVERLRLSRRVLMDLLARIEKEKWSMVSRLKQENYRLQQTNNRYARAIWQKNVEIMHLEGKMHRQADKR